MGNWKNEDNQSEMEDDKELIIAPLEQFFDQESKFNELQVTPKTQSNTTSLEKWFGIEQELNKDLVTTSPKPNMKDSITYFIDCKLKIS